jgi:acid phosphatase (class A)
MGLAIDTLRVSVASMLLLTTACTSTRDATDDRSYSVPAVFDATRLLAPPPIDATARARDLAEVRAAQQTRTPEQIARAEASSAVDVFLFAAVLGPRFTSERVPKTAAFLRRVYRSSLPYLQSTKNCWNRSRPFVVDPTLVPLARSLASTRVRAAPAPTPATSPPLADSPCTAPVADTSYAPSYPSGHAAVGAMMAIVLADMVPEQRSALFAFGWEYGEARVISGVHFPSDVEAGRILGTMLVEMMQQDARFRADLNIAREELRLALGYRPVTG